MAIDSGIVADDREIFVALIAQSGDEIFRNATEPESTQHNGGAILHISDRFLRVAHNLIHSGPLRLNRSSISSNLPASIVSAIR